MLQQLNEFDSYYDVEPCILALASDDSQNWQEMPASNIPVANILAQAWKGEHIARIYADRIISGTEMHPISVSGYRLQDGTVIFTLGDGNHRTVAHRLAGRSQIYCKKFVIVPIIPEKYFFFRTSEGVFLLMADKEIEKFSGEPLNEARIQILRILGVSREVNLETLMRSLSDWEIFLLELAKRSTGSGFPDWSTKTEWWYPKLSSLFSLENGTQMLNVVQIAFLNYLMERKEHLRPLAQFALSWWL